MSLRKRAKKYWLSHCAVQYRIKNNISLDLPIDEVAKVRVKHPEYYEFDWQKCSIETY